MTEAFQPALDFEAAEAARSDGAALVLDLDGFEGPLDVLLALARQQKVDLLALSITALADQYLAFVRRARRADFSLAADYLVMASWLAYLKSRLLLPRPERPKSQEAPPEELAAALAFRLKKLDAMRRASEDLTRRPRLGLEVFVRGDPEQIRVRSETRIRAELHDLVRAYVEQAQRRERRTYRPERRAEAYPLSDARARLEALAPELRRWTALQGLTPRTLAGGPSAASYLASTFAAGLELVREQRLEVRQLEAFRELYLRMRRGGGADGAPAAVEEDGASAGGSGGPGGEERT